MIFIILYYDFHIIITMIKKSLKKRVWQRAEFVTNVSKQQAAASFYSNMTKDEAEFVFFV